MIKLFVLIAVLLSSHLVVCLSKPGVSWGDWSSFINAREVPESTGTIFDSGVEIKKATPRDIAPPPLIDDSLFGDMPQWESSSVQTIKPTYVSMQAPAESNPIPQDVFDAINALPVDAEYKGILAGFAFVESSFNPKLHRFDSNGIAAEVLKGAGAMGHSWGLFQIHDYWRHDDWKAMGDRWDQPAVNLQAFLNTLKEHEKYWPETVGNPRAASARYNGGSRPNWKYADKVMNAAARYQKYFEQGTYTS